MHQIIWFIFPVSINFDGREMEMARKMEMNRKMEMGIGR
jgi:hypothetical protein